MFIKTTETPNPDVLRFVFGFVINAGDPLSFADHEEARGHTIAEEVFAVEGVLSVFIGSDFISVGKEKGFDWFMIKPQIVGVLLDHIIPGAPLFGEQDGGGISDGSKYAGLDIGNADLSDPIVRSIADIIEERVRPAVAMDGGDIVFRGFKDGIVFVSMHGACSGCPSSTITLKDGIENMLKHYVEGITEVRAL